MAMAARMAMIATTIINSIKVKPADRRWRDMVDSPWKSSGYKHVLYRWARPACAPRHNLDGVGWSQRLAGAIAGSLPEQGARSVCQSIRPTARLVAATSLASSGRSLAACLEGSGL